MRKILFGLFFGAVVITSSLSLTSCSTGGQLPPVVCEVGSAVCSVSEFMCASIPSIPDEVCFYMNLACTNLEILCNSQPGSKEYNTAKANLEDLSGKITAWVEMKKDSLAKHNLIDQKK